MYFRILLYMNKHETLKTSNKCCGVTMTTEVNKCEYTGKIRDTFSLYTIIMRKIIERKKITLRTSINREEYSHVSLSTYRSRRDEDIIERVAVPEEKITHKETIIEQDSEFLGLFGLRRTEKRLDRDQYIKDQISADLIKEHVGSIKNVLATNEIIYHQEELLPELLEHINKIKNESLHHAFTEKFYMPNVQNKNKMVTLLQKNENKEKRLEWLEHKYLEAQAKVLECGEQWLFHLKIQHMLFRLSPYDWRLEHDKVHKNFPYEHDAPLNNLFSIPNLMVLPSTGLELLLTFFKQETNEKQNCELYFENTEQFIKPMELLEFRGQIKHKNTIYMEEKLSEQKKTLQDLKEKTENVSIALSKEFHFLEEQLSNIKQERINMEKQTRELIIFTYEKSAKKSSRLEALVAVDSLVETVFKCEGSSSYNMCAMLERKVQTLLTQIFHLIRDDDPPQLQVEMEWIKKEKRELKNARDAHKSVLRMQKLEERLKIALAPPYQKVKRTVLPLKARKKSKKKVLTATYSPLGMEIPYCFEKNVDIKLVSKLYKPCPGLVETAKRENPLVKSWDAVSDFVPPVDIAVEEIVRPRKSTESILELLDSRSSYDFILSTSSDSIGSALRRDSMFYESDDNTSSSSDDIVYTDKSESKKFSNTTQLTHSIL